MNVEGLASKLTKNADKIGMLAGALSYGFDPLIQNVQLLFTQGHFPNIEQVIKEAFVGGMGEKMKIGIMGYIGGAIAKDLGFSQGQVLEKGAEGFLKGLLAQHVLFWSTHSPEGVHREDNSGSKVYSSGESPSWRYQS